MICGYKIGTQLNRVTKYEGRESQFEGKFGTFCTPPPPKPMLLPQVTSPSKAQDLIVLLKWFGWHHHRREFF